MNQGIRQQRGVTLSELLVVVMIIGLLVGIVQINLFGMFYKQTFRSAVQDFIDTLEMTAYAAAENGHRFEVYISLEDQYYRVREITSSDLSQVLEEEIIDEVDFGSGCRVTRVQFDDLDEDDGVGVKFRVGPTGWMYGGRIILQDEQGHPYTVMINRLDKRVRLIPGEAELMQPRALEDMVY